MDPTAPWLIVGLGNPGPAYRGHRHNVGAMVAGELAARSGANLRSHKVGAVAAQVRLPGALGPRAVIATPSSFMNLSGGPVAGLLSFFKVPVANLIVIHDDLDIPFADLRLKLGGGEGGHNGLRSISSSLGTRDYLRVRFGIGIGAARSSGATHRNERMPAPSVCTRRIERRCCVQREYGSRSVFGFGSAGSGLRRRRRRGAPRRGRPGGSAAVLALAVTRGGGRALT